MTEGTQFEEFLEVVHFVIAEGHNTFDLSNKLKCVWIQFELTPIFICCDSVKRNPLGILNFLSVLHGDILINWAQDANDVEVGGAVLVVHLFSHGEHALESGFDASLFEHFALNAGADSLAAVDITAGELPWLRGALQLGPLLLDHEHLSSLVDNKPANADEVVRVGGQSVWHRLVHPMTHQHISVLGVMKVEAVLRRNIHQVTLGRLEEYLNVTGSLTAPLIHTFL